MLAASVGLSALCARVRRAGEQEVDDSCSPPSVIVMETEAAASRAQLVRRWRLGSLAPARAPALHCHHHSVRTLAAGPCETLVSGDAAGGLALWTV